MTKTVYASTCGAKLDSHVHTGGGTDDTAALLSGCRTPPQTATASA